MEHLLNPLEVKAFTELKMIDHDSMWGVAIKNVIKDDSPIRLRRLICELKEQNHDNPEVMKNILGGAYESVIAL